MKERVISPEWEGWIKKKKSKDLKDVLREAILRQQNEDGEVIDPYTGLVLNPNPAEGSNDRDYPSVDHLYSRNDHSKIAITTRVINDGKSIYSIPEFVKMARNIIERFDKGLIEERYLIERQKRHFGKDS